MSLLERIKDKAELRGVASSFVQQVLDSYLKKHNITPPLSPKQEKIVIKEVRALLRNKTGRFYAAPKKDSGIAHRSAEERAEIYPLLKDILHRLNARSVLDLGCGLNPLFLAEHGVKYTAWDIRADDIDAVNSFFEENKIPGRAEVVDIASVHSFPEADVVLILKVFDVLETRGHTRAEQLLKSLASPSVIASFSTKTLSGKPMNHPQRGWIEQLCTRLGYTFERVQAKNEIFYIIKR